MDAIQDSLNNMMLTFNKRLDTIEEQLPKAVPSSPGDIVAEFAAFKAFVVTSLRTLQTQIGLLAKQVDTLEMRSRRKILLLHGIHEDQQEVTSTVLVNTVVNKLKVEGFNVDDVSRCHRMGRSAGTNKPRPILFKLHDEALRSKIWSCKSKLKGSGVTLSEFLTKARHDVFLAARERFGLTRCWTMEGNVYVLAHDGTRHRIQCASELDVIAAKTSAVTAAQKAASVAKEAPFQQRPKRTTASKK